jgi:hypothetical protein
MSIARSIDIQNLKTELFVVSCVLFLAFSGNNQMDI